MGTRTMAARGRQHRHWLRVPALLMLLLCAAAVSAGEHATTTSGDTLVIVVRHAEKAGGAAMATMAADPPLSTAGTRRATALVAVLAGTPVDAIYSTQYRRTHDTALPLATQRALPIVARAAGRDAIADAAALVDHIRHVHRGQTVVVVGHSNTVPDIVAALSGVSVPPIADDEYSRLYTVALNADGDARVIAARYGAEPR